jgi:hypothetical protein
MCIPRGTWWSIRGYMYILRRGRREWKSTRRGSFLTINDGFLFPKFFKESMRQIALTQQQQPSRFDHNDRPWSTKFLPFFIIIFNPEYIRRRSNTHVKHLSPKSSQSDGYKVVSARVYCKITTCYTTYTCISGVCDVIQVLGSLIESPDLRARSSALQLMLVFSHACY